MVNRWGHSRILKGISPLTVSLIGQLPAVPVRLFLLGGSDVA
jgi:hypothetical protein